MQLISLNTWGGKLYNPLIDFVKKHSKNTDVFCFQEVFKTTSPTKIYQERRTNLWGELSELLINYRGLYSSSLQDYIIFSRTEVIKTNFDLSFGQAMFIKKELIVNSTGDFFIYGNKNSFDPKNLDTIPRKLQYITFTKSGKKFTICNLHGIWLKKGKEDAPERLEQSRKINEFLEKQNGEKILCGDFNLDINTKSIAMLEKDMRNLIKEYKISTTRNKYFPGNEKFADYIFVSSEINVKNFEVPDIEVSDHLPMILEFE